MAMINPDWDDGSCINCNTLSAQVQQLRKENKKLRELWAAVQAYKVSKNNKTWGTDPEDKWEDVLEQLNDLNKGNF